MLLVVGGVVVKLVSVLLVVGYVFRIWAFALCCETALAWLVPKPPPLQLNPVHSIPFTLSL